MISIEQPEIGPVARSVHCCKITVFSFIETALHKTHTLGPKNTWPRLRRWRWVQLEPPVYKHAGLFITKTIRHRQVFLFSRLTYFNFSFNFSTLIFIQLAYIGKLSIPKYHEFSRKLLIFPMLQYSGIKCQKYHYISLLTYNLQFIKEQ